LQVEHPVTEMVYGIDLVEWQLRIAAGELVPFRQEDLSPTGHAVEARVYAEDPARGFLPTGGIVQFLIEPSGPGVRVDSGIMAGTIVGSHYDPMLAKVITWGATRDEALARLDAALSSMAVLGVTTNLGFLRQLLAVDEVRNGHLDTGLVERCAYTLFGTAETPDAALVTAAALPLLDLLINADPWRSAIGWRHGGRTWVRRRLEVQDRGLVTVALRHRVDATWDVSIDDAAPRIASVTTEPGSTSLVTLDGVTESLIVHRDRGATWIGRGGAAWEIRDHDTRRDRIRPDAGPGELGPIRSPMPGTVIDVLVAEGDTVSAGQPVAIVEAMKMEHTLIASIDGVVTIVHAGQGQPIGLDDPIVTIAASDAPHMQHSATNDDHEEPR
jgi:acetyl-CoA/propionyl-CoA carboxylase, biotin carboxylase, biotin carboxyl carrier protein